MAPRFVPQALTANRLLDGEVLYWTAEGAWSEAFDDAVVFATQPDADAALAAAQVFVTRREVVNPYLFETIVENGRPAPKGAREIIRAKGPTVRPDFGKQARAH